MALREAIGEALKAAMRAKEAERLSTLRLMSAAIKDRDIAARGEGQAAPVADEALLALLARMVKQRHESARAYRDGGRDDLARREEAEVAVIEEFLPRPLTEAEAEAAVAAAIAAEAATSVKDMGRVMARLRAAYAGRLDLALAGTLVKARLG
jgi:uncharacterized protein YqeY